MHVNGCTAERATLTGLFIVPCLQVQSSPNVTMWDGNRRKKQKLQLKTGW